MQKKKREMFEAAVQKKKLGMSEAAVRKMNLLIPMMEKVHMT